jgi:hypothetical protein
MEEKVTIELVGGKIYRNARIKSPSDWLNSTRLIWEIVTQDNKNLFIKANTILKITLL